MRKLAIMAMALAVAGGALASDRLLGETELIRKLNGSPLALGRISTDGGYARSNCTTPETKFDVDAGRLITIVCNYDHTYKPLIGACTAQAAATDWPIFANQPYETLMIGTEAHVSVRPTDAGVLGTCDVFQMR